MPTLPVTHGVKLETERISIVPETGVPDQQSQPHTRTVVRVRVSGFILLLTRVWV